MNFTNEDIKQLAPEARKFDEGWWFLVDADGKLMSFTHALDLLLTTRLELKQAREQLAEVESRLQSKSVTADQLSREITRLVDHRIASHQPEPQAPTLAGNGVDWDLIQETIEEYAHDVGGPDVPSYKSMTGEDFPALVRALALMIDHRESTLTARISELEGALSQIAGHKPGVNFGDSLDLAILRGMAREALHK